MSAQGNQLLDVFVMLCGCGNGLKQASCQETNVFSVKTPQQPPKSLTFQLSNKACTGTVWLLPSKER